MRWFRRIVKAVRVLIERRSEWWQRNQGPRV